MLPDVVCSSVFRHDSGKTNLNEHGKGMRQKTELIQTPIIQVLKAVFSEPTYWRGREDQLRRVLSAKHKVTVMDLRYRTGSALR